MQQYGLVFISNDNLDDTDDNNKKKASEGQPNGTCGLVTPDAAVILQKHEGNLGRFPHLQFCQILLGPPAECLIDFSDERLKKFAEDQSRLEEEVRQSSSGFDLQRILP